MGTGVGRVEDPAARVPLRCPVVTDRGLLTLARTERAGQTAGRPPGLIDQRRRIQRNFKATKAVRQFGRHGGEGLGGGVPGQLAPGELLAHHIAVVPFVLGGHTEGSGRSAEFVPGGVDGTAHGPRAGLGRPEDGGGIAGAERAHRAVRTDQPGNHVDRGKAEIAVRRAAERLVFVEDGTVKQVCAGVGSEEDGSAAEVLAVAGAGLVDLAVLGAHRRVGPARGVPGGVDRVGRIALRGGEGGGYRQCRCQGGHGHAQHQAPRRPRGPLRQPRHQRLPRLDFPDISQLMKPLISAPANHDTRK